MLLQTPTIIITVLKMEAVTEASNPITADIDLANPKGIDTRYNDIVACRQQVVICIMYRYSSVAFTMR